MKYRYQLIFLGDNDSVKKSISDDIQKKLKDLGLVSDTIKIIDANNFGSEYLGNQPAFGIYFGDVAGDFKDLSIAEKLVKDGTMILPIFFGSFSTDIPAIL